jgi:hypothetical protein
MKLCLILFSFLSSTSLLAHIIELPSDETIALLEEQIVSLEKAIACKQCTLQKRKKRAAVLVKKQEAVISKIKRAIAKVELLEGNSARKKTLRVLLRVAEQAHEHALLDFTRAQGAIVDTALEAEQLQLLKAERLELLQTPLKPVARCDCEK